jgi:prevent-host-death family protein
MRTSTMSAREFNQHVSRAKRAAKDGPVIITERGKPAYVLMRHEEFEAEQRRRPAPKNLLDALYCPEMEDIEAEFPKMKFDIKPAEFE